MSSRLTLGLVGCLLASASGLSAQEADPLVTAFSGKWYAFDPMYSDGASCQVDLSTTAGEAAGQVIVYPAAAHDAEGGDHRVAGAGIIVPQAAAPQEIEQRRHRELRRAADTAFLPVPDRQDVAGRGADDRALRQVGTLFR